MPTGHLRLVAGSDDGPTVGVLCVLFAGLPLWSRLGSPLPLTRCHGRLSILSPFGLDFLSSFPGAENKRFGIVRLKKWRQDGLGFRADGDFPGMSVVFILVSVRLVDPDILGHINIAGPHVPNILWPHS